MTNLTQIAQRHGRDRWADAGFILLAVLLIAVWVGAVTTKAMGKPLKHTWTVQVIEGPAEIASPAEEPK